MNQVNFKQQRAFVGERRHLVEQLLGYIELIEKAVKNENAEQLEKFQGDFDHLLGQLEYVGKRK